MHCVLETESFANAAKDLGISDEERHAIATMIAENPTLGDVIKGTGGARKVRVTAPGRGKRSGYRLITYYAADDVPVFPLDIFAKGEKIDLSQAERNEIKKYSAGIAEDYRASMERRVPSITEDVS